MIDQVKNPGKDLFSPAKKIGAVLASYMLHHDDFYLFSPDETTSNKLDVVYEVSSRLWDLPKEVWDLPESPNGHIVEMLSENALFACMVGHLMNGEPAAMTSYESFFTIIGSQLMQELKFIKQSQAVAWRDPIPAINLLSTSTCWRQDHNGFTHQSPELVSMLLGNPSGLANCLFPIDDVAAEASMIYMLKSQDVVNLNTFNKIDLPRWIDSHQADQMLHDGGAGVLDFISDDGEPDCVLIGAGDIVSGEAIRAIEILRGDLPDKKFRFVNICALSYGKIGLVGKTLSQKKFDELFSKKVPIIGNFHGYAGALKSILAEYTDGKRLHIHGYNEQGSTTTPFEMLSLNQASRYDLAIEVAKMEGREDLVAKYQKVIDENRAFAQQNGIDKISYL